MRLNAGPISSLAALHRRGTCQQPSRRERSQCADRTARDRFQKAADTVFVDPIRTVGKFRTESRNGSSPAAVELIKLKAHPVAGFMIEAASLGAIVMKATDVMVANVATVGQNASVQEIANVLLANRISAVPVVNERDELVGMVSEGDLIRRVESPFEVQRSWWLEQLLERTPVTSNIKPTTGKAADIMSPRVVTATPETSIREIAALLEKNGIKRVPIVRNKKVLGIVSRANLVQALASALKEVKASTATSNAMVREEIMARLDAESWSRFLPFNVIVHDGRVELWGVVDSETTKKAINIVAEGTLGVRSINNNIMVRPYGATTVPGNQQAERAAQPANPN